MIRGGGVVLEDNDKGLEWLWSGKEEWLLGSKRRLGRQVVSKGSATGWDRQHWVASGNGEENSIIHVEEEASLTWKNSIAHWLLGVAGGDFRTGSSRNGGGNGSDSVCHRPTMLTIGKLGWLLTPVVSKSLGWVLAKHFQTMFSLTRVRSHDCPFLL